MSFGFETIIRQNFNVMTAQEEKLRDHQSCQNSSRRGVNVTAIANFMAIHPIAGETLYSNLQI